MIYGHSTGEIVRLDLFGGKGGRPASGASPRPAAASGQSTGSTAGSVRATVWLIPVVETEQQAETAVITVIDDPPAIALFTSPQRLQLFDTKGKKLGQGPDSGGVGRILRTAPGWLAAATDRQILLCDLRSNSFTRLDVSLVQLTHLAIKPDDFGLAVVQERDRIGRLTAAGRWIWKHELRFAIEDLALRHPGIRGDLHERRPASNLRPGRRVRYRIHPRPHRPASPHRGTGRVAAGCLLGEPGVLRSGYEAMTSAAKSSGTARSPGKAGHSFALGDSRSSPQPTVRSLPVTAPARFTVKAHPPKTPTASSARTPTAKSSVSPATACT